MRTRSTGKWLSGALLALLAASQAHAVGTAANTPVSNTATANYNIGGTPAAAVQDTVVFNVDEIVDVTVTATGGITSVDTPDTDRIVFFDVQNLGNGDETFDIGLIQVGTEDFDPIFSAAADVFIDSNDNGTFEPGVDAVFDPTTTDLTLAADEIERIFVRSDIPAALTDGDIGTLTLSTDTRTAGLAGQPAGTVSANNGTGGVNAVVGATTGSASADQSYVVTTVVVTVTKTVESVNDRLGAGDTNVASSLVPGAYVTYLITVTVDGTGTAESLTITDSLAGGADIAYVTGSSTLGATVTTDAADGDEVTVSFTVPSEAGDTVAPGGVDISVSLGDVSPAGVTQTFEIRFQAEIQ